MLVKRLDAKFPISRVVLDLVEWFSFLFDVFDLLDGGGEVVRGVRYYRINFKVGCQASAKTASLGRIKRFTFNISSHF